MVEETMHFYNKNYKPYSFKRKGILFPEYFLTYEDEPLSAYKALSKESAETISHLLNCAFTEGILHHISVHKCDENWRGEKLLTKN